MRSTTPTLADLRALLIRGLEADLADGGSPKRYDGRLRAEAFLPSWAEPVIDPPPSASVYLDCYAIGPSRHYRWTAPTIEEAIAMAYEDVETWVAAIDDETITEQFRGERLTRLVADTITIRGA